MHALPSRIVSQRHLVWLLWFALLLPIAQYAATWHALSHSGFSARGQDDGKQAPHSSHCDLCLTAAAVTGGALPVAALSLPPVAARHDVPQAAFASVWLALPAPAYLSRAPPFAQY